MAANAAVCIATTAFALVHCLERLDAAGIALGLPAGSRVMETGGFKGPLERRHARRALRADPPSLRAACARDSRRVRHDRTNLAVLRPYRRSERNEPPESWAALVARPRCRSRSQYVAFRRDGLAIHVDLANRSTAIAVQTEDLGAQYDDGFVLSGAPARPSCGAVRSMPKLWRRARAKARAAAS